jgi:hypothetical protein
MADLSHDQLPVELADALRAPVAVADRDRRLDAIMAGVRAAPAPARSRRLPPTLLRWRRGVLSPAGAAVVALALLAWGGVTSLTDVLQRSSAMLARAEVLGDTVIARRVTEGRPLRDSMVATLYDTMRIVRFALRAPTASRVALVRTDAPTAPAVRVAMVEQAASGLWELRTVVPRDAVAGAYAFVVDDSRQVPVRATSTGLVPAARRADPARALDAPASHVTDTAL